MNHERIFVALGSNLGDKLKNIQVALDLMQEKGIRLKKVSTLIKTEPYGYKDQDSFINGVAEVEYSLGGPLELLEILLGIEKDMKRERKIHWGPRIIDLDILLWGDKIVNKPNLTIPHPDMQNREFVLKPLAEIAPKVVHPVYKISITELFDKLS